MIRKEDWITWAIVAGIIFADVVFVVMCVGFGTR